MPKYDYECRRCHTVKEELHGMEETPDVRCHLCGDQCRRLISAPNFFIRVCSLTDLEKKKDAKHQIYGEGKMKSFLDGDYVPG